MTGKSCTKPVSNGSGYLCNNQLQIVCNLLIISGSLACIIYLHAKKKVHTPGQFGSSGSVYIQGIGCMAFVSLSRGNGSGIDHWCRQRRFVCCPPACRSGNISYHSGSIITARGRVSPLDGFADFHVEAGAEFVHGKGNTTGDPPSFLWSSINDYNSDLLQEYGAYKEIYDVSGVP